MVSVAKEIGINEVTFQTYLSNWGKDEMEEKINPKLTDQNEVQGYIDEAMEIGSKENIKVNSYSGDYMIQDKPLSVALDVYVC